MHVSFFFFSGYNKTGNWPEPQLFIWSKSKGESHSMLSQTISKSVLNLRAAFIIPAKNDVLGWIKWAHTTTRKAFLICDLHCEYKAFFCFFFLKAKWTLLILQVVIWQCHVRITELALNQRAGLGQDCDHTPRGLCRGCSCPLLHARELTWPSCFPEPKELTQNYFKHLCKSLHCTMWESSNTSLLFFCTLSIAAYTGTKGMENSATLTSQYASEIYYV